MKKRTEIEKRIHRNIPDADNSKNIKRMMHHRLTCIYVFADRGDFLFILHLFRYFYRWFAFVCVCVVVCGFLISFLVFRSTAFVAFSTLFSINLILRFDEVLKIKMKIYRILTVWWLLSSPYSIHFIKCYTFQRAIRIRVFASVYGYVNTKSLTSTKFGMLFLRFLFLWFLRLNVRESRHK